MHTMTRTCRRLWWSAVRESGSGALTVGELLNH